MSFSDPFAFSVPTPPRPLPQVPENDDARPCRPQPLVVPSTMIADEYFAPYLASDRLALTEPFKVHRVDAFACAPLWIEALPDYFARRDSVSSIDSTTSNSSSRSTISSSSSSTSTQRRFSPYPSSSPTTTNMLTLLPAPVIIREAITEWQRPKLAPVPIFTFDQKRIMLLWLLNACSEQGGRDPTPKAIACEAFAKRFGVKSAQVRQWLNRTRRERLEWDGRTSTDEEESIGAIETAKEYAKYLDLEWPTDLTLPILSRVSVSVSKKW